MAQQSTVVLSFKADGVLYITSEGKTIEWVHFVRGVWNGISEECIAKKDDSDLLPRFHVMMMTWKNEASKYGVLGLRMKQEINRTVKAHLEFVLKMTKKHVSTTNGNTFEGVFEIKADENHKLCCSLCEKAPVEGKKLLKCGGCGLAFYCGVECQKAHWKEHKANCRK